MKVFACQNCGQLVHFENVVCMRCGTTLAFLPESLVLSAMTPRPDGLLERLKGPAGGWRPCGNADQNGCNWLLPEAPSEGFCPACRLNQLIPDLDVAGNLDGWRLIEAAKRRLVYALMRLGLPLASREKDPVHGLAFEFLNDTSDAPVLTGHDEGLITINMAETDPVERERRRHQLREPYRTLLGHLRHEVGHYYWDVLVRDGGRLEHCRAVFGDERPDYAEALQHHYDRGAPPDWQENYVSAYATMHPWEDFAETWAHYLHMIDTLDTAASFGLAVNPLVSDDPRTEAFVGFDPYHAPGIDRLIATWMPLTVALNSVNRSMGQPDLYPFALTPPVVAKLGFIHELVQAGGRVSGSASGGG